MQNKKWNRLKISFVAVLAVTWIPAQLCSAFPVYACEADTTAMLIQSAKKQTDISQTQTLTDTGHGIFLCGPNGAREGWGIDMSNGELYYTAPGLQTGVATNQKQDDSYLAADGRMINGANLNPEENLVRSIAYENGEALSFVTDQALIDWESYYVRQYRMTDEDVPGISQVIGPAARKVKWIVQWEKTADKQNDCKNKIIQTYGTINGCSRLAKVIQAVHKLDDTTFDESYIYASLDTAVERKRMVCWQFARTVHTILRESGMETECLVVQRYSDGAFHTMLRWRDEEGIWRYTDPTMYVETKSELYCDMPYSLFQSSYHPVESIRFGKINT